MEHENKMSEQNDIVYNPEEFKDVQPRVNTSKRSRSKPKDFNEN